ncbi:MAG: PilZ domain-containing protein [Deltaproteobacteria bacterium]|nr:PilZ domain-containing protein [Deltaproteobacteria bacterium]
MYVDERRKAVRVESRIPIAVSGHGSESLGMTINISMNGVYFTSEVFIESLKKVKMGLVVPYSEDGGNTVKAEFDGVVVRTEPEKEKQDCTEYKIAVFITFLPKRSREILSTYINRML